MGARLDNKGLLLFIGAPIAVLTSLWGLIEFSGYLAERSAWMLSETPEGAHVSQWPLLVAMVNLSMLACAIIAISVPHFRRRMIELIGDDPNHLQTEIKEQQIKIEENAQHTAQLQSFLEEAKADSAEQRRRISALAERVLDEGARFEFESIEYRYVIDENGTAEVTQVYTVKALRDVFLWRITINADPGAEEHPSLDQIKFSVVSDNDGTDALWFIVQETKITKRVAIFLTPLVPEGETRKLTVRYTWSKFAARLLQAGWTDFFWNYRSGALSDRANVDIELLFKKPLEIDLAANPDQAEDHANFDIKRENRTDSTRFKIENPKIDVAQSKLRVRAYNIKSGAG